MVSTPQLQLENLRTRDVPNISRVVHVVVDIVKTRAVRAAVLRRWAPRRRHGLDGRVRHRIASTGARLTLEDVEETEPCR